MSEPLVFQSEQVRVEIDPGRGADVLSLVHIETGIDVLFSTPWRRHADAIRRGTEVPSSSDSVTSWMEQYRGGWQTLFPNAGQPRTMAGAAAGFHGEASTAVWRVVESSDTTAELELNFFTVPVELRRRVTLAGNTLHVRDRLRNLSSVRLEPDYVSHPAFGGAFLDGTCSIDTGARFFRADPTDNQLGLAAGSSHEWPWLDLDDGQRRDLRLLSQPGLAQGVFGWLSDFESGWASIHNHDLGISALLEWDSEVLPYAWVWQEFNNSSVFPWFGRARVIAIEPASTQTSGDDRSSVFALDAFESAEVAVSLTVGWTRDDPALAARATTNKGVKA